LFALIAIATRDEKHRVVAVPHSAKVLVVAALPLLLTAAAAGIAAGFPLRYVVPQVAPLHALVGDQVWRGSGVKTAQRIAEAKLSMLERARSKTRFKGWMLIVGFLAEGAAITLVAAAVGAVVL
jgi:hypothetical protein